MALAEAEIERVVEAALLVAGEPLSEERLLRLFAKDELPAAGGRVAPRGAEEAVFEGPCSGRAIRRGEEPA